MPLLLDTCTLIWAAQDHSQLSAAVQARLEAGDTEPPIVSAISAFEIAVKWRKGKLSLPLEPETWFNEVIRRLSLRAEPMMPGDALRAALLPRHHDDPADRIIIATAARLMATIVTPDHLIQQYAEAATLW